MMSGTCTQKKITIKSQRRAIVDNFCKAGTDRLFYAKNVLRVTHTRVISLSDILEQLNAMSSLSIVSLRCYSMFYQCRRYETY